MEAASSRRYSLQKTILRDSRIPTSSSTTSNRGELMRCEQLKLAAIDCLTQCVTKLSVSQEKFVMITSIISIEDMTSGLEHRFGYVKVASRQSVKVLGSVFVLLGCHFCAARRI